MATKNDTGGGEAQSAVLAAPLAPPEAAWVRAPGSRGHPQIRMHDKLKALQLLGEHTGAFRVEQRQPEMVELRIVVVEKRKVSSLK